MTALTCGRYAVDGPFHDEDFDCGDSVMTSLLLDWSGEIRHLHDENLVDSFYARISFQPAPCVGHDSDQFGLLNDQASLRGESDYGGLSGRLKLDY